MGVRRIGATAMVAVLAIGLAACGDDGGDDNNDVSLEDIADGSGSGTEDTEPTDDTEATGDTEPDESTDDTDDTDVSIPDLGNLDECLEISTAYASLGLAFLGGSFGGEEEIDVDQIIGEVEEVRDEAPDDVAEAFDVAIDTYAEVFENLGGDLSAVDFFDPDVAEALEPLNSDEFTEANETVSAYLDEICTAGG